MRLSEVRRADWRRMSVLAAAIFALPIWLSAQQPANTTPGATTQAPARPPLPSRLTDQQFWTLSERLSEPAGYFRSENLVSNEHTFQYVIPALQQVGQGGVYLGVAPDQN